MNELYPWCRVKSSSCCFIQAIHNESLRCKLACICNLRSWRVVKWCKFHHKKRCVMRQENWLEMFIVGRKTSFRESVSLIVDTMNGSRVQTSICEKWVREVVQTFCHWINHQLWKTDKKRKDFLNGCVESKEGYKMSRRKKTWNKIETIVQNMVTQ